MDIAKAFFIPLIAAMAGNVGIQSSAIIVQGIASNSLGLESTSRKLLKELLVALLNGLNRFARARAALAVACTAAYGALDEWHQSFVPGRHASWADVAADAAGVLNQRVYVEGGASGRIHLADNLADAVIVDDQARVDVATHRDHVLISAGATGGLASILGATRVIGVSTTPGKLEAALEHGLGAVAAISRLYRENGIDAAYQAIRRIENQDVRRAITEGFVLKHPLDGRDSLAVLDWALPAIGDDEKGAK